METLLARAPGAGAPRAGSGPYSRLERWRNRVVGVAAHGHARTQFDSAPKTAELFGCCAATVACGPRASGAVPADACRGKSGKGEGARMAGARRSRAGKTWALKVLSVGRTSPTHDENGRSATHEKFSGRPKLWGLWECRRCCRSVLAAALRGSRARSGASAMEARNSARIVVMRTCWSEQFDRDRAAAQGLAGLAVGPKAAGTST
jgi:hypothetical protein